MDESQVVYGADDKNSKMAEKIETKSDVRAEIDTSAPFDSVKEAVSHFGGVGYWKPSNNLFQNKQDELEEISIKKLEEQASELEKDLILKQRETLDILQQLESTRAFVEDLKMELRKNVSKEQEEDKENNGCRSKGRRRLRFVEGLKQAQQHLTRTTNGISEIRASMEVLNKKLERERLSVEKTKERLKQNCLKMSSVEERLNQTRKKLEEAAKDSNMEEHCSEMILKELEILNSEGEKFKQMGEAAKCEIMKKISKIERRKAEIRLEDVKEAREEIRSRMEEVVKSMEEVAVKEAVEKWGWEEGKKMEYSTPVLKPPTLSIGQILSRKLFLQEEFMPGMMADKGFLKRKVSLAQMLGKQNRDMLNCVKVERWESDKKYSNRKRKESGFTARFPFLGKQNNNNQKRKKPTLNLK